MKKTLRKKLPASESNEGPSKNNFRNSTRSASDLAGPGKIILFYKCEFTSRDDILIGSLKERTSVFDVKMHLTFFSESRD